MSKEKQVTIPQWFLKDLIYVIENKDSVYCDERLKNYYLNMLRKYEGDAK